MELNPQKLPPTFRESSPVANGLAVRRDPLGFFNRLAQEAGDVAHFALSDGIIYFVHDPEVIGKILSAGEESFTKWSATRSTNLVLGEGILTSKGPRYRKVRRATSPALHQTRLPEYAEQVLQITDRRQRAWPESEAFDFAREMALLALDAVAEVLFHTQMKARSEELLQEIETMQRLHERFGISEADDRVFFAATNRVDQILRELLKERAASNEKDDDLFALIMEVDDGNDVDDRFVQEARTFFLAGNVTTGVSLATALWLLSTQPEEEQRLQDEIERELESRAPKFVDLPRLKYTEMVLLETLRLYPPVWMLGRRAMRDVSLGEYWFPEGAKITICPWLLHRDTRLFPEPEKFQPERWANDARAQLPRGAYLPFSLGPRSCMGERFAMMEGTLVLARLIQRWRFESVPERVVHWERHATLAARDGIWLRAFRRSQSNLDL